MLLCSTKHPLRPCALTSKPACRVMGAARLIVSLLCRLNLRPVMSNEAVCQVGTLMTLLNGCLLKSVNANETLDGAHYERIFLYCLAWAVGGLLDVKDRPSFDTELRTLSQAVPHKASCSTHVAGYHGQPANASKGAHAQKSANASGCTPASEALQVPARASLEWACLQEGFGQSSQWHRHAGACMACC